MTEIGIIFERVKIVPRVIEILNSIARYSEICLGICFKSEIKESGCSCIKTLLSAQNFHQSLPASATSLNDDCTKMDREETHVQAFQKLSYFMVSYIVRFL